MQVALKELSNDNNLDPEEVKRVKAPESTRQHADPAGWHRGLRGIARLPQAGGDDDGQLLQRPP
eukprot:1972377-Pyramimonas_sp.AAC.1